MDTNQQHRTTLKKKSGVIKNVSLGFIALLVGSAAASLATIASSTPHSLLLGLILLFVLVATLPIAYRLMTDTFDTFEMINVAILFYSLYVLSVPIRVLLSPDEILSSQLDLITRALALCLVGLVFFLLGYHNCLGNILAQVIPPLPRQWQQRRIKLVACIYVLIGLALFLGLTAIVGIRAYFEAGYAGRALLKREFGPLELGLYVIQIGLLLYTFYYLLNEKRLPWWIIILYALYTALILRLGIRRPLLGLLLAFVATWHYSFRKLSFAKTVAIMIAFGTILVLFAFVRQTIASEGFSAGIGYLISNFSWTWFDLSRTEFGAPFKNLLDILTVVPNQVEFLHGLSYWQSVENLLPRFLHLARPPTLSEWYTNLFFSNEFIRVGGNMGFFIVSEAYINWDVIGVMIVMFGWGILLKALYVYMKKDLCNTSALFLYSVSLVWIIFAMRIDFAGALKGFLITAFLPVMFAIILVTTKLQAVRSS